MATHELWFHKEVEPADIDALALPARPQVSRLDAATIELSPQMWLTGPYPPPPDAGAEFGSRYLLQTPRQRGAAVPVELQPSGSLLEAFSAGEPLGQERVAVEFALALLRRLGGMFWADGMAGFVPEAHWDVLVIGTGSAPAESVREHLLADAAPVRAGTLPEEWELIGGTDPGYVLVAAVPGGHLQVAAGPVQRVPWVLRQLAQQPEPVVAHEIRFVPEVEGVPPPRQAVARLDRVALLIHELVGGHVVDDDGFLVELAARP